MAYRIGAYLLDPEAYELSRDGVLVPVEPQVIELLVFLIANRERALSKDEIIELSLEGAHRFGCDAEQPHQDGPPSFGGRRIDPGAHSHHPRPRLPLYR